MGLIGVLCCEGIGGWLPAVGEVMSGFLRSLSMRSLLW